MANTDKIFDVQSNARAAIGRAARASSLLNGNNLRTYVAVALIKYHKNVATSNGIKMERPNHKNKINAINNIIPFMLFPLCAAWTCIQRVFYCTFVGAISLMFIAIFAAEFTDEVKNIIRPIMVKIFATIATYGYCFFM